MQYIRSYMIGCCKRFSITHLHYARVDDGTKPSTASRIGTIAGGVIGGIAVTIILILLLFWCCRPRPHKRAPPPDDPIDYGTMPEVDNVVRVFMPHTLLESINHLDDLQSRESMLRQQIIDLENAQRNARPV